MILSGQPIVDLAHSSTAMARGLKASASIKDGKFFAFVVCGVVSFQLSLRTGS